MKTIWHHGAWNRNFGDWVLYDSIHYHLNQHAGHPLYFVPVDSQKAVYSDDLIARLNSEADALIIGGGGLLFHRPEDSSISGWQFNIPIEKIEDIHVPIIVYGIGYNRFFYDETPFPPIFADHVHALQKKSTLFSVRNTGTLNQLKSHGLPIDDISVVPDAGVFAPKQTRSLPIDRGKYDRMIGVNIAGDRPHHRFPMPSAQTEKQCMHALATSLNRLCDDWNACVLLLPHIDDIDERFDSLFSDIIGHHRTFSLKSLCTHIYPPSPITTRLLMGAYNECDIIIGGRGHSGLIAYGCHKPFIAFGSHLKNSYLLEDIHMSQAALTPDMILSQCHSQDYLIHMILQLYANYSKKEVQLKAKYNQDFQVFDQFNQMVVTQLLEL